MGWDFSTDADYQAELDWVDTFLREQVEPLDLVLGDPYDKSDRTAMAIVRPLQQQVKDRGLWAAHLGPELGGQGYGQHCRHYGADWRCQTGKASPPHRRSNDAGAGILNPRPKLR